MIKLAKRSPAFDAVKAELISMIPLAFRAMAKPYITDDNILKILNVATRFSANLPHELNTR
jgi:hypothetical protein